MRSFTILRLPVGHLCQIQYDGLRFLSHNSNFFRNTSARILIKKLALSKEPLFYMVPLRLNGSQ